MSENQVKEFLIWLNGLLEEKKASFKNATMLDTVMLHAEVGIMTLIVDKLGKIIGGEEKWQELKTQEKK